MKSFLFAVFSALIFSLPISALGCGACIEDKLAVTYDYDVVQTAHARQQTVVFCDVKDRVATDKLRRATASVRGVNAKSIRISSEPAALSFALDTKVQSPEAAIAKISEALQGKIRLSIIRKAAPGQ